MISGIGLFAVILVIALAQFQLVVALPLITGTSGSVCTTQNGRAVNCPLTYGLLTVYGTGLYTSCFGSPTPAPLVTLLKSGSQPVSPQSPPLCQDESGQQTITFAYPILVSGVYSLNYTTGGIPTFFSAALTTVGASADPTISSLTGCSNSNIDGSTSYCLTGLSTLTIAGTGFYCGQSSSTPSTLEFEVGTSTIFNSASTSLTIPRNKTYLFSDLKATFTVPSTSDWLKTGKPQPADGTQMYIRAHCPPLTTWGVARSAYTTGLDPAILSFFQQFYTAIVTAIVLFVVLCIVVPIAVCVFCCAGCCATAATAGAIIGRRNQPKTSGLIYSNEMPQTAYVNMR